MLSLQEETAGISRTIQEAQKQKARLETADGASAAEADQVAALLEAVEKKVRILGEQLTVMVEDYRKSAFRENTVKLLVAASAPEAEMISGQWRRTILILEAVLLIVWLGAGVGYGLKQSSVAGAKRYQESGEDSAD